MPQTLPAQALDIIHYFKMRRAVLQKRQSKTFTRRDAGKTFFW